MTRSEGERGRELRNTRGSKGACADVDGRPNGSQRSSERDSAGHSSVCSSSQRPGQYTRTRTEEQSRTRPLALADPWERQGGAEGLRQSHRTRLCHSAAQQRKSPRVATPNDVHGPRPGRSVPLRPSGLQAPCRKARSPESVDKVLTLGPYRKARPVFLPVTVTLYFK